MADQMASSQAMQGTTLIGKDALVDGDALAFSGSTGKGAFTLDGSASSVVVDIIGKNGETLDTLNLGAREAGQHGFEWPAGSIDPNQVAKFSVRASNGSTTVTDTELQRVRIASVGLSNGAMNIQLANGRTLAYDQVRGFM
jgi:flagellar basal-body rod modification protein FlgD